MLLSRRDQTKCGCRLPGRGWLRAAAVGCEGRQPTIERSQAARRNNCRDLNPLEHRTGIVSLTGWLRPPAANAGAPPLQLVERTANAKPAPVQHVRVLHRGADVRVAEQFLHRSDIVTIDEQLGRK